MKNHGESLGTAGRTIKDPVSTRPSLHGRGPTAAFLLPGGTDMRPWIVLAGLLADSLVDGSIVAIRDCRGDRIRRSRDRRDRDRNAR